jgi:hypothetical protein
VVEAPEDQRTCLENVLSINPSNERARQGIAYLTGKPAPEAPLTPPETPAPPPPASPRAPTSVEWDMPATETSSSSAPWRPTNEPTADEYDDWVSGLNLQSSPDAPAESGSPFSVPAFSTGSPFLGNDDEDDDLFTSGPFSSAPVIEEAPPAPQPTPEFTFQKPPTFASAPKSPPPASTPKKGKSKGKAAPRMSPSADAFPAELKEVDAFFKDLGTKEEQEEIEEESELFGYIPKGIKATRLPGTRERTPIILVLATLLLIVLNIGVAALLVMRFLTPV